VKPRETKPHTAGWPVQVLCRSCNNRCCYATTDATQHFTKTELGILYPLCTKPTSMMKCGQGVVCVEGGTGSKPTRCFPPCYKWTSKKKNPITAGRAQRRREGRQRGGKGRDGWKRGIGGRRSREKCEAYRAHKVVPAARRCKVARYIRYSSVTRKTYALCSFI